jgi:Fe-S-cluster containining protein
LHDLILVHEEMGDDPSQYDVEEITNLHGHLGYTLKRNEAGHCIYLREGGCSIHHRRPAICREFDCRGMVRNTNRSERRQALKNGLVTKELMKRGVELLPTLKNV